MVDSRLAIAQRTNENSNNSIMHASIVNYKTILITLFAAGAMSINQIYLDGIEGMIFSAIYKEDTVYAPGYSDVKFKKIIIGASSADVIRELGMPIKISDFKEEIYWSYAISPTDSNYRKRIIVLTKGGHVKHKYAFYYID